MADRTTRLDLSDNQKAVTPEVEMPSVNRKNIHPSEVNEAAKTLGMSYVSTETLEASRLIGQEVSRLGTVSVGRGVMIRTINDSERIARVLINAVEGKELKPEMMAKMANVAAKLLAVQAAVGKTLCDSEVRPHIDPVTPLRPPPPGEEVQYVDEYDNIS